jgi:hypothetical protein
VLSLLLMKVTQDMKADCAHGTCPAQRVTDIITYVTNKVKVTMLSLA